MKIGIIGLGYVGLPLVIQFAKSGAHVLGIDVDETKVNALNAGESYIKHIPAAEVRAQRDVGQIEATTDCTRVSELDAVLICVPTPLDDKREPDLTYVLIEATLAIKLFSWMSLDYSLRALRQPLVIDDFQIQNSLLLNFSYAVL